MEKLSARVSSLLTAATGKFNLETGKFDFPISLSPPIIGLAILICIAAGITAGVIPAARAAKMNPVAAIRS